MWFSQFWSPFRAGRMHCLPQRLKSTFFEIFSNRECPKGTRSEKKFRTTLILVFEVIVQQHGNIFWHFQVRPKSWKSHIVHYLQVGLSYSKMLLRLLLGCFGSFNLLTLCQKKPRYFSQLMCCCLCRSCIFAPTRLNVWSSYAHFFPIMSYYVLARL